MKTHRYLTIAGVLAMSFLAGSTGAQAVPPVKTPPAASTPVPSPVFQGKDGYLFLDHELVPVDQATTKKLAANLAAHAEVFRRYGTKVIFVVVPAKLTILNDKVISLPNQARYDTNRYVGIINELKKSNLTVVDLKPALDQYHQSGKYPVWMLKDSHWSPVGSFEAGKLVGQTLARDKSFSLPKSSFTVLEQVRTYEPDLYRLASEAMRQLYSPTERLVVPEAVRQGGNLLDDDLPAIALFGSSYSAKPFQDGLRVGAQSDVVKLSQDGGGIWGSLEVLWKTPEYKGHPPKVLIWEFPERYVQSGTIDPPGGLENSLKKLGDFLQP